MSGRVVVDASVALKWVFTEQYTDVATDLLIQWTSSGVTMLAPALFAYELANVLYRKTLHASLPLDDMKAAVQRVLAVGVLLDAPSGSALHVRAMEIAGQCRLTAAYDAHYLALAEREACECWTADERLWNAVRSPLPWVRWLGELSTAPTS